MKWIDILTKAEEIESHYVIIQEPTENFYGKAIKLHGDPNITILRIDDEGSGEEDFKIGKNKYWIKNTMTIDVKYWEKLKEEGDKLIKMES